MADLRNTIAHILEHKQHLAEANEATIQQYVVLPILRALGWDDVNLASMEVLPEYKVESRRADYALHVKRGQRPVVLIECKRWGQPIGKNEEQICFYAYSGNIPLAIITNGKRWRFYLSGWKASSLSDRIFCETDIENEEDPISNLEKYLLKSNVASGEAELNAEIALDDSPDDVPICPKPDLAHNAIDSESMKPEAIDAGKWTIDRIKNSLCPKLRDHFEKKHPEDRLQVFYKWVVGVQNLVKEKEWEFKECVSPLTTAESSPKFSEMVCGFWLTRPKEKLARPFGTYPGNSGIPPVGKVIDRNGKEMKINLLHRNSLFE